MESDLYKVLGVKSSATNDEIRAAYRKLAKKYHPDLNPGNPEAEKRFKSINAANDILGDPKKREKFDRGEIDETGAEKPRYENFQQTASGGRSGGPFYYETQRDGGRYSSAFEGFGSDFFEELLKGRGASPRLPTDEHYLLEVDFKSAALGSEQEMVLPTGKSVKVHIPPGFESGKKLRLKGLATSAAPGQEPGDVYIEIRVRPSKIFSREGKNLLLELPVTLSEAILGGEVRVPTLEKAIMLKVPAGSNTGTKLKAKGKGIGAVKESERGDLLVTLKVVMPTVIDNELKEAIQKWSGTHSYNPREALDKEGGAA